MKPVYQSIIDRDRGDCWRACIASILEVDLEVVPNFSEAGASAHERCIEWLTAHGLRYVEVCGYQSQFTVEFGAAILLHWGSLLGAYAIASAPSQMLEGCTHAIVVTWTEDDCGVQRMEVVHDPNPRNTPYNLTEVRPHQVAFIVPVVPKLEGISYRSRPCAASAASTIEDRSSPYHRLPEGALPVGDSSDEEKT